MASLDLVKLGGYTLLIGFIAALSTFMYDIFAGIMNTWITTGQAAPISVQVGQICYYANLPFAIVALLFTCLSALLVANARTERLSPYFSLNPWGIVTCGIAINVAMIGNFCITLFDPIIMTISKAMPVVAGGGWDMTVWLSRGFSMIHILWVFLIVLGFLYLLFNSLSVESQQAVV